MTDELDDLKAAFDAGTPAPDETRKRENIALAEKNFANAQGLDDGARQTIQKGPIGSAMNGVRTMIEALTTRGGLTATTALVAVGFLVATPQMRDLVTSQGPKTVITEAEYTPNSASSSEATDSDIGARTDTLAARDDAASGAATSGLIIDNRAKAPTTAPTSTKPLVQLEMADESVASQNRPRTLHELVETSPPPAAPKHIIVQPTDQIVQPVEGNTEAFANAAENDIKTVTDDPVSTFSIDVDTASYGVVRSSITSGALPPKGAVRVEEMINYFPYAYPAPDGMHPFQPTVSVVPTPWNDGTNLVHIAIQGTEPAIEDRPPLNLVFLIDTSGSMNQPNKLPLLRQSFALMLSELRAEDEVSIVTYAGSAGQVLEPTPAGERSTIMAALDRLSAGGSTAGQAGLQQAYQVAESMAAENEVTRVILATDGDFNVGLSNPDALKDFIADKRESGTYLSVLGFGRGNLDDATMQALAQNGNGTAAYIDTLAEARKVLVDQLTGALFPIANDVKIQVEFNPAKIAEYRLIGYETRALNREDFNNDRVDAGDIGAGHRVTAIYEVTPVGSDAIRNGPLRYSEAEVAAATDVSDEFGFFKLRYKNPGQSTSILIEAPILPGQGSTNSEIDFSVAMAGFGQLLKGGDYLGDWGWDDAISLATTARGEDAFGYRAEAITLMRLAEALDR